MTYALEPVLERVLGRDVRGEAARAEAHRIVQAERVGRRRDRDRPRVRGRGHEVQGGLLRNHGRGLAGQAIADLAGDWDEP